MVTRTFVGRTVVQTLLVHKLTSRKLCGTGTFRRFKVFCQRISVVNSNGYGIYLTQAIKMVSWKPSSNLSDCLAATCKSQSFAEEQWRTFLSETTHIINGRPLYPSSNDIWEGPPITPNDILIGHHLPPPQPESEERVNPRHLLRSTQNRVNEFWKCWMRYFTPNLLPRNKWFRTRENVKVDDLVLELDPNQKRSRWKLARVVTTYPRNNGLVRKARIKTQIGEYDRPIHKLCLIATKEELNT